MGVDILARAMASGKGGGASDLAIKVDSATDEISLTKHGEPIPDSGATLPKYGLDYDTATGGLTLTKDGQGIQGETVALPPYGSPLKADTASAMQDTDKVYVYTGSESGYENGHWYYYDSDATPPVWTDGGVYNAVSVVTDKTLTVEDVPADAKATGEAIDDLKTQLNYLANNKGGITGIANTWETIPFSITAGKDYTFYNKSSTASVSVRTRATEDGSTVDSFDAIGPNNSKTITASANANFLRIQSTAANSEWEIKENGTEIDEIENNISILKNTKLDKSTWENQLTDTVIPAGTFVNFPFLIEKDHVYQFSTLTKGNTMSFRTRATEDGATIDLVDAVGYGVPKTFTASADASIVRVQSFIANGLFKIEDTESAVFEFNELKPSIPIVNLPSKIYAVSGLELNIYFDNIVSNAENYNYNITCAKGKQMKRGYAFIPVDADAGTYDFVLDVLDNDGNTIKTVESSLIVTASTAGSGTTKTMILLGDSTVNGTDIQIVNDFTGDEMILTTLGTRGTAPALHEGRSGWSFQYYYGFASIADAVNPFYNPSSRSFDADYYFNNSGIAKPDWFFIQLGINDVFAITDDTELNTKISSMVTQCNYMITSIKNASPATKIGIAITIPPNYSQDAFGKAYGCGQTRNRYKYNNMKWVERLIEEYDSKENENIYLVPIFTNLDTVYNMGFEEQQIPVNARNEQFKYWQPTANGGVHPVESGYMQLADVYKAFIKSNV